MSFLQTIEDLKTVRDYRDDIIPDTLLKRVVNLSQKTNGLLPGSDFHLRVIEDGQGFFDLMNGKAGYYGKMIPAPHYIVYFQDHQDGVYENSGYVMESLRLRAWEEGLGTCWISMEEPLDLAAWVADPVEAPAIALLAIGYPEQGVFRKDVLKKSSRLPLTDLVFMDQWGRKCPMGELEARGLSEILYYGKWAPSWGNLQPWRFLLHKEKIYLTIHVEDQETRARIDAGIVMLYVQQAAHDKGITMNWELSGTHAELSAALKLPDTEQLVAVLS